MAGVHDFPLVLWGFRETGCSKLQEVFWRLTIRWYEWLECVNFHLFCKDSKSQAVARANCQNSSGGFASSGMSSSWNANISIGFERVLGARPWLGQFARSALAALDPVI